tara:strand:+ start:467 stop:1315 length:849 start_codon:yes stop_codon:yes gene_type:complete
MMFLLKNVFIVLCVHALFGSSTIDSNDRLVTIGGSITDIVFALGEGKSVVAVDQSSTLPKEVKKLPQAGYVRAISAEGILSMLPTKILSSSDIGPPNVISQLESSKVEFKIFESPKTFEDVIVLVDEIANFLDVKDKGHLLKEKLISDKNKIDSIKMDKSLNVAFFMNPSSTGTYSAAGSGTRANYLINFIGASNIFENSFSRYNKVSKETIIDYNPDVIFVAATDSEHKTTSVFLDDPTFRNLNAVKNNKIIYLDLGYHLTFGSKFGESALLALNLLLDNE